MSKRPANSLMIINSASNHSKKERQSEDFYATHPRMVEMLLDIIPDIAPVVWEPANGMDHISDTIEKKIPGTKVIRTDIVQRTPKSQIFDFLDTDGISHNVPVDLLPYESAITPGTYDVDIITNPPYFKGTEFLEKACEIVSNGHYVIFFVKLQYLETTKRYEVFKKFPPYKVLISVRRVHCGQDGTFANEEASGGAACYIWYIFKKGYKGEPTFGWFNTGDEKPVNVKPLF